MSEERALTRQELCVKLRVSESTIRRLELDGLPHMVIGRNKRYDLPECKAWLRTYQPSKQCQPGSTSRGAATQASWSTAADYIESSRQVRRRAMPSGLKLISAAN